jgi:hypothetical protein
LDFPSVRPLIFLPIPKPAVKMTPLFIRLRRTNFFQMIFEGCSASVDFAFTAADKSPEALAKGD